MIHNQGSWLIVLEEVITYNFCNFYKEITNQNLLINISLKYFAFIEKKYSYFPVKLIK